MLKITNEKRFERELLAAKLMKLQQEIGDNMTPALKENTKKLITDCLQSRTSDARHRDPDAPTSLTPAQHYALLDAVRKEAAIVGEKNPDVKGITAAIDQYKSNPEIRKAEQRSADKAAELQNDPAYQGFLDRVKNDPKVMQKAVTAARSGHGGEMTELFREYGKKSRFMTSEGRWALRENTLGGRLAELRDQAKKLHEQVAEGDSLGKTAKQQARELLGEYIVLDSMTRDPKTGKLDEAKLGKHVPWSKVQKTVENAVEKTEDKGSAELSA